MNDGYHYGKVPAISWFTNLDITKRHDMLDLRSNYFDPEKYPRYDNYFARMLSDKVIMGYLQAAKDGTLKYRRAYGEKEIQFSESGIDPLCLDLIDESFRPIVMEIKGILENQLRYRYFSGCIP